MTLKSLIHIFAALALLLAATMPAAAQAERVTGEARRFLVFPVHDLIDFSERNQGEFSLSYQTQPAMPCYYFNVNASRFGSGAEATDSCRSLIDWHRSNGYQVSTIGGYACAFVAQKFNVSQQPGDNACMRGPIRTQLRSAVYVSGAYMVNTGEAATPPKETPPPIEPLLAVLRGAPVLETPAQVVLVTPDGKTISLNLSEWNGGKLSVQQMALVKQFQLLPPAGSDAAKAGGSGYGLNVYNYPSTGPNVPVYVAPRLDQDAQAAASAAVEGAQAAAFWVKANPGKASLAALGLAVSIAMPYTVAFQASAAGMTFFESAGIGFMTAAAPSAVSSLMTSAISGEGFWKTTGKAALYGTISGAESFVSTTVGAGVTGMATGGAALTQKLVGTNLSEATVTGFGAVASGVAGTATDLGVGVLHDQVAENIASSATAANIADLVTPSGSAPTGGLVLPLLSRR